MAAPSNPYRRIAYLGPQGTFTEEELLNESDLATREIVALTTIGEALAAVIKKDVDAALVPIENSIEGSVNATLDGLIFGDGLCIQREVVLDIHLDLLGIRGATLDRIRRVLSFPH